MPRKEGIMIEYNGISFGVKNWVWEQGDLELMRVLIDRLIETLDPEEIARKAKMSSDDVFIFAIIFEHTGSEVFVHVIYYNGNCETWVDVKGMSEL